MRSLVSASLVACLVVRVCPALAADGEPPRPAAPPEIPVRAPGLQLGAHVGSSWPVGRLLSGSTYLSDLETIVVPIGVEAGYRFSPWTYLGGTVEWSPGVPPNSQGTCVPGASCFRQDAQLRIDARLYLKPLAKIGWWLGAGAGYEIAAFAETNQGKTVTSTFTGPVFLDARLGFDVRDVHQGLWSLGPYFGLSVAEFLTEGINPAATPVSTSIPAPSVHVWVSLGLRGTYGPW